MTMGEGQQHLQGQVMIVAGEASGDMHGASLVRAMQARMPSLRFCGMGGRELERTGVEMLGDAAKLAVVGVTEVLSHLGDILQARRALIDHMQRQLPALLILIDYPDFNLWLAATAKKLGIPIFYYISPQIWAWRSSRVHTVDFVGHPLVDAVKPQMERADFLALHRIDPAKKLIGLLPGSRNKEVAALLPDFLAAAELLARDNPEAYTFLIPQASTLTRQVLDENGLAAWNGRRDFRVISEDRYALMAACDAVVAASGTVLLELAILGTPMVATYRTSRLTYILGRLLVRHLPWFSLVNLIGDRAIIPELLQEEVTPGRIAQELKVLLEQQPARETLQEGLKEVQQRLGQPGASDRAAKIALQILNQEQRG